ncbi:MAG TPA: phosphotransferase [Herpetosiphonaceae bacterium]
MPTAAESERLRQRITACAPALDMRSLHVVEEGWDSRVAVVDDTWIFRFPRSAEAAAQLEIEQALLPALASGLPLAIPDFSYACHAALLPELPFVGYRMISGAPLSRSVLDAAGPTIRSTVARQLAEFLQALHSFPIDEAQRLAPTLRGLDRTVFAAEYAQIQRQIFPLLSAGERAWIARIYAIAADDAVWHFQPVLVHNDLTIAHILFDSATQRLAGVIDFGDIALGDPAIDLTGLLEYGPNFVDDVIRRYDRSLDAGFRRRLRFYRPRMWLTDLRYRLDRGDTTRVATLLATLREYMAAHTM